MSSDSDTYYPVGIIYILQLVLEHPGIMLQEVQLQFEHVTGVYKISSINHLSVSVQE